MSGWIFASGCVGTTALTQSLASGATTLPLPGAQQSFAPGALLCAAPAAATASGFAQAQWLGKVLTASPTQLTWSLPTRAALPAGARLWCAASFVDLPVSGTWATPHQILPGIAHARSAGGTWFSAQLTPPCEFATLQLSQLTTPQIEAWRAWLLTGAQCGLAPAALITPEHQLHAIRFGQASPATLFTLHSQPGARWQLTLPLTLLAAEVYPL
jgi:hypothetical protein